MVTIAQTPVPGQRNGGIRITATAAVAAVWALLVAAALVATNYVYATKGELGDVSSAISKESADLRTRSSVLETHVDEHHRLLEKHDRVLDALDSNMQTLMLEMAIPRARIVRPKQGD